MKKIIFFLLLAFFAVKSYSQAGDLFVGAQGGFVTHYGDGMYGLNVSYHLNDPLEVSFTGLFNPKVSLEDDFDNTVDKLGLYSANLDLRYYMLLMDSWAMGPALGYQYLTGKYEDDLLGDFSSSGLNIGWHARANLTDAIKLTGGWRYTMGSEEQKHHYFYIGIGYTFSLY
jgi:hypothetical protein